MIKKDRDKLLHEAERQITADDVRARLLKWHPDLKPVELEKLGQVYEQLLRFNSTINLVSPTSLRTADSTHFSDSISASRLVAKGLIPNEPVYDIGSGNGFPGLIFALLYPTIRVVLVDRDSRKTEYLKTVVSELKLANVTVESRSVESLAPGVIANAMLRGFAPLSKAMLTLRKQVRVGGRCFHMKSDAFAMELAQVPSQVFSVWSPSLVGQYRLPESDADMAVVLTKKNID